MFCPAHAEGRLYLRRRLNRRPELHVIGKWGFNVATAAIFDVSATSESVWCGVVVEEEECNI